MVPEGWRLVIGDEITQKITKGQSPKWQGFDYQESGTLFVTSENVRDGYLDLASKKYLPLAFNEKLKGSQLRKGDILLNIVGASIGRSCLFDLDFEPANINQAVCLFRPNGTVNNRYVSQFFQLPRTILALIGAQSDSARPNLTLGDLRNFKFCLPPLSEQNKIAKILSTWDEAIATTEKLLANSEQQKKALMQQLLTGKKRLPGFEGEWTEKRFEDLVDVNYGKSPKEISCENGKYPIIGTGGVAGLSNEYLVDKQSVVIGRKGTINKPLFMARAYWPIDTTFYCLPREKTEIKWFYYLVSFIRLERLNEASGVPSLSRSNLNCIKCNAPGFSEQEKIANVLSGADQEITLIRSILENLKQQKKALMQQLLTGKRRVKVDEAEPVPA